MLGINKGIKVKKPYQICEIYDTKGKSVEESGSIGSMLALGLIISFRD